ncbi:MAG: precorrin-6y C5,15-methyltransferase (decarboxylating) subunit CbiE [Cytophagaceae bacterium]|nr:MAG: precorrin-6y C5,15-methyltransferase (decarboxylating) subunit CbiE [Cytophagaceae bacterium]
MASANEPAAGRYTVVGLPNQAPTALPAEVQPLVAAHAVFSGGRRHYELVKSLLPSPHTWITIAGDMPALFAEYRTAAAPILVFASGDPLFFGIVRTIQTHDPGATVAVFPSFNSVQRLCAKIGQPYEQVRNVSVHGRSWQALDEALLRYEPLLAVLTDAERTPDAIARRLLEYNFLHYEVVVGEDLDGPHERIATYSLPEAAQTEFRPLNCVLLRQTTAPSRPWGLDDAAFVGLPGRPGMITKKAIRLLSLAQLGLAGKRVFWDVGFCTGSVAIEACRLFPQLTVVAFEQRPECKALIEENMRQLSALGIAVVMGDFFTQDLAAYPPPEAVFVGGHGGRLPELLTRLNALLPVGGTVVLNAVLEQSHAQFLTQARALGWEVAAPQRVQLDAHNPIWVLTASKVARSTGASLPSPLSEKERGN